MMFHLAFLHLSRQCKDASPPNLKGKAWVQPEERPFSQTVLRTGACHLNDTLSKLDFLRFARFALKELVQPAVLKKTGRLIRTPFYE